MSHFQRYTFYSPHWHNARDARDVVHATRRALAVENASYARVTLCEQDWEALEPLYIAPVDAAITCIACIGAEARAVSDELLRAYALKAGYVNTGPRRRKQFKL